MNLDGRVWSRHSTRGNIRRECSDTHAKGESRTESVPMTYVSGQVPAKGFRR